MPVTKLGIGTATAGLMEARTSYTLLTAVLHTSGIMIQPLLGMGCYIQINRQMIADDAIRTNCSRLLFVDSDMMFLPDGINRLLAHDLDIVGARYNKRILNEDGTPCPTVKEDITELSEVPFVPTGFIMINCDVFRKMEKPWFSFRDMKWLPEGEQITESEDVYFCKKAAHYGFKIHCDPTIPVNHLGTAVF